MKYDILLTSQASKDLRSIFEYIAFDLCSIESAKNQLEKLEKGIMSLNNMPERFRIYNKEPWQSLGLRIMPVDNYQIFYIPNNKSQTVNVIRILYSRRDIDTHLKI